MNKPQIALLHYTLPPVIGGVENVIAQHAQLLTQAGFPVTLIAGRGGQDAAFRENQVQIIPELDSQHPINLKIAQALEQHTLTPEFYEFQSRLENALGDVCAEVDILIVHNVFNFHFNLPLTAALCRLLDRGVIRHLIAWCHDISRYVNPDSGEILRDGFPWDLLRTFRSDVRYVAVSQRRQRMLAKTLACDSQQIAVIPNGVDAHNLLGLSERGQHLLDDFGLLETGLIMLMPVRITRAKNIEYAMHVTAALKSFGMDVKLIVTGPPDPHSSEIASYIAELLALRQKLLLAEQVVLVYEGTARMARPLFIDSTTVGEFYRAADLVLMPSHREGFGLPILEAGLMGKPIFCTDIPVVQEIGNELVRLIVPGESPASVAARIQNWADQDISHRLRRCVRNTYTWDIIFMRFIEPMLACIPATQERAL